MTIQSLIDDKKTGLVLIYGANCAPCARLKPQLLDYCTRAGLQLFQFDFTTEMPFLRERGVRGVPTVLTVKNGEILPVGTGEMSIEAIHRHVADHVLEV